MALSRYRWTSLLLLVALVASSCSGQGALDALTVEERAFVIPDAGAWGGGDPCEEGDCAGPLTIKAMQDLCWAEFDPTSWNVERVEGEPYGDGFFEIMDVLRGPARDVVLGEVGNDRSTWMEEASVAKHRLVLGTQCEAEAPTDTVIFEVIAIDDQGRIAGIGFGAELFTTVPLARAAVESGADSGEAYLLSILKQ